MVLILLYHRTTYSQKEKFPLFTRPDGLIDKNPRRNATQLLVTFVRDLLAKIQTYTSNFQKLSVTCSPWPTQQNCNNLDKFMLHQAQKIHLLCDLFVKTPSYTANSSELSVVCSRPTQQKCGFLNLPYVKLKRYHLCDLFAKTQTNTSNSPELSVACSPGPKLLSRANAAKLRLFRSALH